MSFASADHFLEEVEQKRLLEEEDGNHIEVIVLPFGSVHDLDKTAIEMLRELLTEWRKRNISCIVADAKSRVRLLLEENFADGAKPLLDQQAFMISLDDAVSFAKLTMARKRKKLAAQDDSAVPAAGKGLRQPLLSELDLNSPGEREFHRSTSSKV